MPNKRTPEQELARRTRRGFIGLGAGAVAATAGWKWLNHGYGETDDIPAPMRRALQFNERVVRGTLYSNENLVKTYPASAIKPIKVNGLDGMDDDFNPDDWSLWVAPAGGGYPTGLYLDDVKSLPRHEQIIDFKCVEGWSTVTQFAGARLSDFTAKFAPGSEKAAYVGMETPGAGYYVGLDMPSALHPQTLLAWEMNGEDLTLEHGAPLRLVIPVKYGIKCIKRIGTISYRQTEPADYWGERGYDFYAGL
jgi:DMSO/TMAO reductase YedYZ molybdopterin-dependent catalytic subunit